MTVLCGTDFSTPAANAATVAALLAAKLQERLTLVHVVEVAVAALAPGGPLHTMYAPLPEHLEREAERLRELKAEVSAQVVVGVPDEVLVQIAEAEHARLIVLASLGRRAPLRWLLGSVAERTAQTAPVPVLVVRGSAALQAWLGGERPLRVMIGVDLSESARIALEWAAELRLLGACDLTVAHIAWPLGEQERLGIPGPVRLDRLHPEVEQALVRDVTTFMGESLGDGPARVVVGPGLGRLDVHLAELAASEQADLLVVGSHQRAGLSRVWHGSVSRGALLNADMSVACVPVPIGSQRPAAVAPRSSVS
jgi:nucleotide-binding universal stress UspA family protein